MLYSNQKTVTVGQNQVVCLLKFGRTNGEIGRWEYRVKGAHQRLVELMFTDIVHVQPVFVLFRGSLHRKHCRHLLGKLCCHRLRNILNNCCMFLVGPMHCKIGQLELRDRDARTEHHAPQDKNTWLLQVSERLLLAIQLQI